MKKRFLVGLLSLGTCSMFLGAKQLHAQTIHMQPTIMVSGYTNPQFYQKADQMAEGKCNGGGLIYEGVEGTTLYVDGNEIPAVYSFCRYNYSATSYSVYEYFFVFAQVGGPPVTTPKCVGSCVQPDPDPPTPPLPPPYTPED